MQSHFALMSLVSFRSCLGLQHIPSLVPSYLWLLPPECCWTAKCHCPASFRRRHRFQWRGSLPHQSLGSLGSASSTNLQRSRSQSQRRDHHTQGKESTCQHSLCKEQRGKAFPSPLLHSGPTKEEVARRGCSRSNGPWLPPITL
jgi:hypothetical protein